MTDDLHSAFTKRTANAIAFDVSGEPGSSFKSLDDLKKQTTKNPQETIRLLGRVPGLGKKGILEVYGWATGQKELPRSEGSVMREKQRNDAKTRRVSLLKQQIERAQQNIAAWRELLKQFE